MSDEIPLPIIDIIKATEPTIYLPQDGSMPQRFPAEKLIQTPLHSQDELQQRVEAFHPPLPQPDTRYATEINRQVQFVNLDQVVGGTGIRSWEINESSGRGYGKMYEFAQAITEMHMNIQGHGGNRGGQYSFDEPLAVKQCDGLFYIIDGRHRITTLKALGVPFAPMIVTNY